MIVSAFLSVINADNAYENLFHCMAVDNKMNVTGWKCWKLGEPNILYRLQVKCCRDMSPVFLAALTPMRIADVGFLCVY